MSNRSAFTPEIAIAICERLSQGESLRSICRDKSMPSQSMVFRWLAQDDVFREQYTRAREVQAEVIFDEILHIADTVRPGSKKVMKADGGVEITKGDMIDRARLQVDARKWVLARMNPKKYGDKFTQELTGADGGPVMHAVVASSKDLLTKIKSET